MNKINTGYGGSIALGWKIGGYQIRNSFLKFELVLKRWAEFRPAETRVKE